MIVEGERCIKERGKRRGEMWREQRQEEERGKT
jgi:hypothetical protein